MITRALGKIRSFVFALVGRLILAAGTALLVMGVGSMVLGPIAPSNGLGDYLLPSEFPDEADASLPIASSFPTFSFPPTTNPTSSPSASPTAVPTPAPLTHLVTRIVLKKANVDLPVIEAKPKEKFPYCDVAERLDYYTVPGNNWVTYLYAHARPKMFGGLLVASWKPDSYLLGATILVYTDDDLVYTYKITELHRHQKYTSFAVADSLTGEVLVLQTCEDASGIGPKLIVVARPVKVGSASHGDANPDANPRACA